MVCSSAIRAHRPCTERRPRAASGAAIVDQLPTHDLPSMHQHSKWDSQFAGSITGERIYARSVAASGGESAADSARGSPAGVGSGAGVGGVIDIGTARVKAACFSLTSTSDHNAE